MALTTRVGLSEGSAIGSSSSLAERYSKIFAVRGGSDDEESGNSEDEEEDVEENADDEDEIPSGIDVSDLLDKVGFITKKTLDLVGKVAMSTAKAFQRAIKAGLEGDEDAAEDFEEPVLVSIKKVFHTLQRMIKAAFTFSTGDEEETVASTSESDDYEEEEPDDSGEPVKSFASKTSQSDFGAFLSKSFGVTDERDESGPAVLGGTLSNALQEARSQARMLVIYLPSGRPQQKKKGDKDQLAIESLLSSEVADAANKRARKSGEETGSFVFWGAKAGSSEATSAAKRLKAKATSSKGEKRPILMVVYPAVVSRTEYSISLSLVTRRIVCLEASKADTCLCVCVL
jgi:hypothetical protein